MAVTEYPGAPSPEPGASRAAATAASVAASPSSTASTERAAQLPDPFPDGIDLPPYSVWRRIPEWEPRGRWLRDRPQITWPDTVFSVTRAPWLMRLLLIAGMAVGQATMAGGLVAHLLAGGLIVVLWVWIEWWQTWDLAPLHRRLIAIAGQGALTALAITVSPLSGLIIWSHYMICGTFFTGPMLIAGITGSSVLITAVQVGGFDELSHNWTLTVGLFALDIAIGVVTISMANRREEAVLRRHAVTRQLLAEQQRNAELHAELVDQARTTGIRQERARLARELHDTVAQGLVAVVTQLEAIDDDALPEPSRRRVGNAKELARQGLAEARRAVDALRPPALENGTLPEAVEGLLAAWSRSNQIATDLTVSGTARATAADAALIRVTQEALSNAARHSRAGRVTVSLDYLDGEVLLDIHDDGTGFDPAAIGPPTATGGHGLPGMAERVRLAGGSLTVESEPGGGTVVSAAVPG